MLISEWAEENIVLSKEVSVRPGPYVPEKFQRIIMDAICDPHVRKVSVQKSTQVGWTQLLLIIVFYYIAVEPRNQMLVFVRDTDAENKSKKTIAPMVAECKAVRERVIENKSRTGGNTITLKQYPGGDLSIAGANSAANLRSDQRYIVEFDEVDGYPDDVDGEGDPLEIGARRTDTYPDEYKLLYGSTPAKPKGLSKIESICLEGDQTYFHVPCPHCSHYQPLLWRLPDTREYNLYWETDADGAVIRESVFYRCSGCRRGIAEKHKQWMLDRVREVKKFPNRIHHRSFYLNALYAPWGENWHVLADEWQKAKGKPERLRAFINLRLGETWDEGANTLEPSALRARCEKYDAEVPMGVAVLVATVDVQQDRLEAKLTGFGVGEEEWQIDHEVFYGSPSILPGARENEDMVNVWDDLDDWLLRSRKHASGAELRPAITLIDVGYATDACYNFIQPRQNRVRMVFACKGQDKLTKVGLVQEGKAKNDSIRLFNVATYAVKTRIMDRLRIGKPGPAYMHFPDDTPDDYFAELTGESRVPIKNKRTGVVSYVWVKNRPRNEVLDMTVYAHAGLWILQKIVDPFTYNDLSALARKVQAGEFVQTLIQPRGRRIRSAGVQ